MEENRSRIAVVCMVYNSCEYLSEFILYYNALADHIFLIDHKSKKDLRNISLPNASVVRSNHLAQFQSECTNKVIEHFDIANKFDWLFVLDIDEFLPFSKRHEIEEFLGRNSRNAVLHFYWKNGTSFHKDTEKPESLIDCDDIRFFKQDNINTTACVNLARMGGNFLVPTGAHHIWYKSVPWYFRIPKLTRRSNVRSRPTGVPLYHILAFDRDHFVRKIKNYVDQIEYRSHVKGQGGWLVFDYPSEFDNEQWLWYIANFRVRDPLKHCSANLTDFERVSIFDAIDRAQCLQLRAAIKRLPAVEIPIQSQEEKAYLSFKSDDTAIAENVKWFHIDDSNEILCVDPNQKRMKHG